MTDDNLSGSWLGTAAARRAILLLALVLFAFNLWGTDLWAPDEPFFGEGAREMVVDGQWLVVHVNGEVNTHKPPLFFWLIALFSLPFGAVSSLTARLPSLLAGLGSVWLTMRLGRATTEPRTAHLAGLLLATSYIFWDKARSAQIDALLCFLILVALSGFAAFRAGELAGRPAGLLFWGAAGLAVLAKGPVGLLLPLGIALVTLAWDRDLRRWRGFAPFLGPLCFAAVVALWVVPVELWGRDYSVWGALREHFVDRAVHGMHHAQPFWYYLKVLPVSLQPWSFLIPGAILLAWRRRSEAADRFLLTMALFTVLFFSISTEKRDLYILPALPAFALLAARLAGALAGFWDAKQGIRGALLGGRWVTVGLGLFGALLLVAAAAVPLAGSRLATELMGPSRALAILFLLGGGILVWSAYRRPPLVVMLRTAGIMSALLLFVAGALLPLFDAFKSGRPLAVLVRKASTDYRAAGHRVLSLDAGNIPIMVSFFSNGVYVDEAAVERLEAALASGEELFVLANEDALPQLSAADQARRTTLYSQPLNRRQAVFLRFGPRDVR